MQKEQGRRWQKTFEDYCRNYAVRVDEKCWWCICVFYNILLLTPCLDVVSPISLPLSCYICIALEGWDLGWNKCWAPVRWLTRATTTRTSPATPLLPSSAHWLMPSSLHQARNHNSLQNHHVSRESAQWFQSPNVVYNKICIKNVYMYNRISKRSISVFFVLHVKFTLSLVSQSKTRERASQSRKTLCQTV